MADPVSLAAELDQRLQPLEVALARAWWDANTTASEGARRRREELELERRNLLADPDLFSAVRAALAVAADPVVRRQLEVVLRATAPNQVDEATRVRLTELETQIEGVYVGHRGEIDGTTVSDNEIGEILTTSDDVELRRKAWVASKSVGAAVADALRELVDVRNAAARSLGYDDHYAMALELDELDETRLFATLDEVDETTTEPFRAWKRRVDEALAARFGCAVDELRPWHYDDPFFQEPPVTGRISLDDRFRDADIEGLTSATFDGMGIDIRSVLERSDLYGRDGKNQHAFCVNVDRSGDVRVLANIVPNERWVSTMLHEFGHGAYDVGIDDALPFVLREPAHMLLTEAVAMMFGRLARDPEWLGRVGRLGDEAESLRGDLANAQTAALLVFARWALVMIHFERGLYREPDADHDTRWWDLVGRFQLARRPDGREAPDWAAKIHLAVAPVYYQNYLYGELLASQLEAALQRDCGGIVERPDAGQWLNERVFAVGAADRWDRIVEAATGQKLTASHFAAQLT